MPRPFPRERLQGSSVDAARALLGARLVRDAGDGPRRVGRIVEVEAYGGPRDRASHARAGRTPRTALMFGPAGLAYVYLVYGMHDCLNVVTGIDGTASAVLVRAAEAVEGREAMIEARTRARARRGPPSHPLEVRRIATGPGVLCAAFSVDRASNGFDLCDERSPLRLELPAPGDRAPIEAWTARIGVAYAGAPWAGLRWRLVDRGSPALSTAVPNDATSEPEAEPVEQHPAASQRLGRSVARRGPSV